MAERTVQTIKRRLCKMFQEGQTLWDALASIRSTPVDSTLLSPAVLLQGRHLRGVLPFTAAALQPRFVGADFVRERLRRRQADMCFGPTAQPYIRGSA